MLENDIKLTNAQRIIYNYMLRHANEQVDSYQVSKVFYHNRKSPKNRLTAVSAMMRQVMLKTVASPDLLPIYRISGRGPGQIATYILPI